MECKPLLEPDLWLGLDWLVVLEPSSLLRAKRLDRVEGSIRADAIHPAAATNADVAEQVIVLLHAAQEPILDEDRAHRRKLVVDRIGLRGGNGRRRIGQAP